MRKSSCLNDRLTSSKLEQPSYALFNCYDLAAHLCCLFKMLEIFDSWAGMLSPEDFMEFSYPYLKRIILGVKEKVCILCGLLMIIIAICFQVCGGVGYVFLECVCVVLCSVCCVVFLLLLCCVAVSRRVCCTVPRCCACVVLCHLCCYVVLCVGLGWVGSPSAVVFPLWSRAEWLVVLCGFSGQY